MQRHCGTSRAILPRWSGRSRRVLPGSRSTGRCSCPPCWPPEIQKIGWGPLNGENDDEAMDLGVPYFQTIPSSNPSSHCRKVGAVSSNTLVFGILEGHPVNHRVSQAAWSPRCCTSSIHWRQSETSPDPRCGVGWDPLCAIVPATGQKIVETHRFL